MFQDAFQVLVLCFGVESDFFQRCNASLDITSYQLCMYCWKCRLYILLTYVFWNLFGKIPIILWSTLRTWYARDCVLYFIVLFPVVQVSSSLEQRKWWKYGLSHLIFAVLTRRPLLEAPGGSSPESSITKDAQSVSCVCRMTEKNGGAWSSRHLKKD